MLQNVPKLHSSFPYNPQYQSHSWSPLISPEYMAYPLISHLSIYMSLCMTPLSVWFHIPSRFWVGQLLSLKCTLSHLGYWSVRVRNRLMKTGFIKTITYHYHWPALSTCTCPCVHGRCALWCWSRSTRVARKETGAGRKDPEQRCQDTVDKGSRYPCSPAQWWQGSLPTIYILPRPGGDGVKVPW